MDIHDLEKKFRALQVTSAKAFTEFKELKQKYTDLVEENDTLKEQLQETYNKWLTSQMSFDRLSTISKKAFKEFNDLKQKHTEEIEKRIALEEYVTSLHHQIQNSDRDDPEKIQLIEETQQMRSRLERMEHTFHESKRMSDSKELTYRNRIEQLETELGFEKKKREAAEREVEIAKQQSHQKLPSSKTLDGLLQDLEKRIRDDPNPTLENQPMKPNPSSLPPLPSNPVRRPSTPPPMERVRTQSRTAHDESSLPKPPPSPPQFHPKEYKKIALKKNENESENIAQALQEVKLKKVDQTPRHSRSSSRPLSFYNTGSIGQLASLLNSNEKPSEGVSERSLASISEGRTDIDDIFRELEMSLN